MTPHTAGSMLVVALLLWTHLTAAADPVASTARQTMASAPQQPQAPPATLVGNDGAAMRLVPAGEFLMGSEADDLVRFALQQELVEDEMPRHRVYLDAFYMDQYEVTNAHFHQFVHATGYRTQAEREGWGWADTGEDWGPVTGATWRTPLGPGSSIIERFPVACATSLSAGSFAPSPVDRKRSSSKWEPL
jgi:formylglycine-generating enzyme